MKHSKPEDETKRNEGNDAVQTLDEVFSNVTGKARKLQDRSMLEVSQVSKDKERTFISKFENDDPYIFH